VDSPPENFPAIRAGKGYKRPGTGRQVATYKKEEVKQTPELFLF
jgi:hypothetical protein